MSRRLGEEEGALVEIGGGILTLKIKRERNSMDVTRSFSSKSTCDVRSPGHYSCRHLNAALALVDHFLCMAIDEAALKIKCINK